MTGRERVLAALSHREPDRVPMDFGSTGVTGMHVRCIAALRDYFGSRKDSSKYTSLIKCWEFWTRI